MKAIISAGATGLCLLIITLTGAQAASAKAPLDSEVLRQRYLQAIDSEIQRTQRLLRRELETQKTEDPQHLARLATAQEELRRLEARLVSWEGKQELEHYRRNLLRFLRSLYSSLRRLGRDIEMPGLCDAAASPGRTRWDPRLYPRPGCPPGKPRAPSPRPFAAESDVARAEVEPAVPVNDDCGAATPIGDGTFMGSSAAATNDGGASCGASEIAPDVWFRYTASATELVEFNTFGASFDTVLSLHSGCPGTTANEVACNDDWNSLQSRLQHELTEGQEVLVRVSGYGGDNGAFLLSVGRPGEIAGRVVDAESSQGLADVDVDIYDEGGTWVDDDWTDASGGYSVAGLSPGTYYAKARKSPYITELYDDIECFDWCDPESGTPIVVQLGESAVVDFSLTRGGGIAGTITDALSGEPLYDIEVGIYDEGGRWVATGRSNDAGSYVIWGLESGAYYAVAWGDSGYIDELYDDIQCPGDCDPTSGTPISVDVDQTVQVDFALQLGGSIAGTVTDAQTGQALDDARVRVYDESGYMVEYGWSGVGGAYEVLGLVSGTYYAVAEGGYYVRELYDDISCLSGCDPTAGTPIAVTIGEQTTGIDFALDREGAISGIVLDEAVGVPLIDFRVEVWDEEGDWVGSDNGHWGIYTVGGLPAGIYHATTDNNSGYQDELYDDLPCTGGQCEPTSGTPIAVAAGMNTTGIDFDLVLGGAITGTVTDVATGSPISGSVQVWSSSGEQVGYDGIYDGDYSVSGLPTGDYFVGTDTESWQGYTDELYDNVFCPAGCDPTSGTPVAVVAGDTTRIDFGLCGPPVVEPHFPPSADPDSFVDGCHVQIGGIAAPYYPGCPAIERVHWDWGDGKSGDSLMPASHWYAPDGGMVTVSVTAYDILGRDSETVQKGLNLWDCLVPGACGYPDDRELVNLTLDSTEDVRACRSIVVGPGFYLVAPGNLTLLAGEVVVLENGVFVGPGCRLQIGTDPALLP